MTYRHLIFSAALLGGLAQSASAQDGATTADAQASGGRGILSLIPSDAQTDHVIRLPSGELPYTATAGTIDIYEQSGQRAAKIFYTSYVAKDRAPGRPLTFVFNGGPGAASAYLHLGLMGPRIADFGPSGDDGRKPALIDNPESWLAFSDLVFIDPVGTGWSRPENDDKAKSFYGVRQDAESLAKFISLYVQRTERLPAPKFLVGESYGGFRAAKVAAAMKDSQGLLVSGIVMVSPFLDGRFLANSSDPLSAALQLPSLGAARMEREGTFSVERLKEIERFSMGPYLTTLVGPSPAGEAGDRFYRQVSEITGIAPEAVNKVRGFVGDIYAKRVTDTDVVVSPYDASYAVPDAYPEATYNQNDDPILDGYTRAYGSLFTAYARRELQFSTEVTYTLLSEDVNRRWEWNDGRRGDARALASVSGDMRDLLSVIPGLRMAIVHGYSDALTPYGASRYVIDHLPPALTDGRVSAMTYPGGHMFYTRPASRLAVTEDIREFYRATK